MVEIGDTVTYVDPVRSEHNAVVTAVWGNTDTASVNLVYVSIDETKTDQYGRQIERSTSVPHKENQHAPGNYWK